MGVPRFFRTISERYPHVNVDLTSAVAPALDNLYIDMNGVVHNCARGTAMPGEADGTRYLVTSGGPRSYADTFLAVFKYLDMLFGLVRPRRLVYFAIDGVAPRAKMNQQRSRRFRSARERETDHQEKLLQNPIYKAANQAPFDSNCITPGTVFMTELTNALEYFLQKRMTEDAAWSSVEVVLSGAESQGEGEHKIMEYIRHMKVSGQMLPNVRHCVYGLDADLIMLGLVTHEPHFVLLREKVDYEAFFRRKPTARPKSSLDTVSFGEFQLLSIGVLREYLAMDIGSDGVGDLPFFNIERVVDDFIFIAMLVGNDFLPHLPTIEMADGALGTLILLYKRLLRRFGGYLTEMGTVNPKRFEMFTLLLGLLEPDVLPQLQKASGRHGRRERPKEKTVSDLDRSWGFSEPRAVSSEWSEGELDDQLLKVRAQLSANAKLVKTKRQYYKTKMHFDTETEDGAQKLRALCASYLSGMCWTLKYYTEGCADWRWFFDEHYAPMASDFVGLSEAMSTVKFVRGTPFKPMEQLLSVLPPASAWCLPKPYQALMTQSSSPIKAMYPTEFEQDLNGKRNDWEAIVLLPFIDEKALLDAVSSVPQDALTPVEHLRNTLGVGRVFKASGTDAGATPHVVKSPFPGRLPDFPSTVECKPLELPFIEPGSAFPPWWIEGTRAAGSHPSVADLPTFAGVPVSSRLAAANVNVFGQSSRRPSLMLTLGSSKYTDDEDGIALVAGIESDDDGDAAGSAGVVVPGFADLSMAVLDCHHVSSTGAPDSRPCHWESVESATKAGLGVGEMVWVGYPWRAAACVEEIADAKVTVQYPPAGDRTRAPVSQATVSKKFENELAVLSGTLSEGRAVCVADPRVLFRVRVAVEKHPSTGVPSRFASARSAFVDASVVAMKPDDMNGMAAAIKREATAAGSVLPPLQVGDQVICMGKNALSGCVARVSSVDGSASEEKFKLTFRVRQQYAKEPVFGMRVVARTEGVERWYPNGKVASLVKLPPFVLGSVTGSIRVRATDGKDETDIGLGIKYASRGLYIPGYAKVTPQGQFLLSERTVRLIQAYKSNFPDMFARIVMEIEKSKGSSGGPRVFSAKELFGSGRAEAKLKMAASWVGTCEVAHLPLVAQESRTLTKGTISELEVESMICNALRLDANEKAPGDTTKAEIVLRRHLVASGCESASHLAKMFANGAQPCLLPDSSDAGLGYRVANISATGPVPLGLRGTIVGVHPPRAPDSAGGGGGGRRGGPKSGGGPDDGRRNRGAPPVQLVDNAKLDTDALIDVVFDEGFIGGGDLNGRCTHGLGKAVRPETLMHLLPQENPYYTKHRARIAGQVKYGKSSSTNASEAVEQKARVAAMAKAAVSSYVDAVRAAAASPTGQTATAAAAAQGRSTGQNGGASSRTSPTLVPAPVALSIPRPHAGRGASTRGGGSRGRGGRGRGRGRGGRATASPAGSSPAAIDSAVLSASGPVLSPLATPFVPEPSADGAVDARPDMLRGVEEHLKQMLRLTSPQPPDASPLVQTAPAPGAGAATGPAAKDAAGPPAAAGGPSGATPSSVAMPEDGAEDELSELWKQLRK